MITARYTVALDIKLIGCSSQRGIIRIISVSSRTLCVVDQK